VPAIAKQLASDDPQVTSAAAYALGRVGPKAKTVIPEVEKRLKSDSLYTRVASAWALAQIDSDKERVAKLTLPILIDALKSEIPMVRAEAINTLATLGPAAKEAVPALNDAVNDRDPNISNLATRALEQVDKMDK
jgi:HEAT repeat protein